MTQEEQERERRDQETHDAVIQMKAVLLGVDGRGGLLQEVGEVCLDVKEMKLKCGQEEINVTNLLVETSKMGPRIEKLEEQMSCIRQFCRNNRALILWIAAGVGTVAITILATFLRHIGFGG